MTTLDNLLIQKALSTVRHGKQFTNPKIIILMGLPGSGKSFVADHLNKVHGVTIVSGENISNTLFKDDRETDYVLVYRILRRLASQLLNQGYSIVIDGTNLKYSFRKQIYDEVCIDNKSILIYLVVDQKTALKRISLRGENRNDKRNIKSQCTPEIFENFVTQLEEPAISEPHYKIKSDSNLTSQIDSILGHTI